jgi:hypothetical protein
MRLLLQSSTALWRRGVPERIAPAVIGFLQRGEYPGEQPVWFLLWQYSTGTQSTSGNRFFAPAVFKRHTEHLLGVDQLLSCIVMSTFGFLVNESNLFLLSIMKKQMIHSFYLCKTEILNVVV